MESIRQIAVAICATMAVTGILSILIPGKSMERTMQLLIGVFFLASIVIPLSSQEFTLALDDLLPESVSVTADIEATTRSQMQQLTQARLEQQVLLLLEDQSITPQKVQVTVHIDEDNRISITNLSIVLSKKDQNQEQEVSSTLQHLFGVTPQIVITGSIK